MNKEVSFKTLIMIIVILGVLLGFFIYYIAKNFSDTMSGYINPIQQEHSYLNSL